MNIYIMCLTDLVYELLVTCKFLTESASYLIQVGRLIEAHYVNFLLKDYFVQWNQLQLMIVL